MNRLLEPISQCPTQPPLRSGLPETTWVQNAALEMRCNRPLYQRLIEIVPIQVVSLPNCKDLGELPEHIPSDHILRRSNMMCVHPSCQYTPLRISGLKESFRIRFLHTLQSGIEHARSTHSQEKDLCEFAECFLEFSHPATEFQKWIPKFLQCLDTQRSSPLYFDHIRIPGVPDEECRAMSSAAKEILLWCKKYDPTSQNFQTTILASADRLYDAEGHWHLAPSESSPFCQVIQGVQSASRTVLTFSPCLGIKTGVPNSLPTVSQIYLRENNKWDMVQEIISSRTMDTWIHTIDRSHPHERPLVMREPFARAEENEQGDIVGGFILRDTSLLQQGIWAPGFSISTIFSNDALTMEKYCEALAILQTQLLDRYGIWHANLHGQNIRVQISDEGTLTDRAIAIDLSDFGILEPIATLIAQKYSISLSQDDVFPDIKPFLHMPPESFVAKYLQSFTQQLERLWSCPGKIAPLFDPTLFQAMADDQTKYTRLMQLWAPPGGNVPDKGLDYNKIIWIRFNDWLHSEEAQAILKARYTESESRIG